MHDLGIEAITDSGKHVFVGLEAKVDESFGPRIKKPYLEARTKRINGKNTNADFRIEGLIKSYFPKPKASLFDLRYQLLHGLAGTVNAKTGDGKSYDHYCMLVMTFQTSLYDPKKGQKNLEDFNTFMKQTSLLEQPSKGSSSIWYKGQVADQNADVLFQSIKY